MTNTDIIAELRHVDSASAIRFWKQVCDAAGHRLSTYDVLMLLHAAVGENARTIAPEKLIEPIASHIETEETTHPPPRLSKPPRKTTPDQAISPCTPSRASQIQEIIADRAIKHVLHFTRLDNIPSIAQHGLLPRGVLSAQGIPFVHNDEMRIDGAVGATCLTLSWPNYKMFYRYRTANSRVAWVVFSLQPSVLWENDCAFCIENAASSRVRAVQLAERKRVSALATLFAEHDFYPDRATLGIPGHFPTNPQAEILLFGSIPLTAIQLVLAPSEGVADRVRAILDSVPIKVWLNAFRPRKDWEFWRVPPVVDGGDAIF